MVASIIRTVQTRVLTSVNSNPPVATINLDRWLYIETYLVIITASIPCIRPLVRFLKEWSPSTDTDTHELGSPHARNSRATFRTRNQISVIDGNRLRHVSDGNGSEDNIPGRNYRDRTPESRITKQVDIDMCVEKPGPT